MSELPDTPTEPTRTRWQQVRKRVRGALGFASGVASVLVALLLYNAFIQRTAPPLTPRDVGEAIGTRMAVATPRPAFSVNVYQAIQPSLIFIETSSTNEDGEDNGGLGTGVVVNDRGDILTSLHVVTAAQVISVTFADGISMTAEIISTQPENDIAVLRPNGKPKLIVPATLGSPQSLRIGDEAYAVGNPLGLYGSMSSGVISGLNRNFSATKNKIKLKGLIQFDAAVNPGNSGGPLLNRYGQVVGIVTGLVNPSGQDAFSGIGFAVPINVAGGAAGLPPF